MNRQFSLLQSLRILLIASSVSGGQLPTSITAQYAYCYEIMHFGAGTTQTRLPNSELVDNVCMDMQRLTFHFLSSAQGGTISYITAPKTGMFVTLLFSIRIGIRADCLPVVGIFCQFAEPAHALQIYNDIYQGVDLTHHRNFSIGRIHRLVLDIETRSQIISRQVLAQRAGVYTEFYKDMRLIFTFKEESANGDVGNAVLVYLADHFNISDILVNNNVVLRFSGFSVSAVVMTFRNESEAIRFRNALRRFVNSAIEVQIPPPVQEFLQETRL